MRVNSTQSRKGVKGQLPLAESRGSASGGVWGNAPTVFRALNSKGAANKGAGSEASLPVTSRVLRRAPKLLIRPTVLCRAKWARPCCWSERASWSLSQAGDFAPAGASRGLCDRPRHPFAVHTHVSWSLLLQGISPLRRRVGGFAVAPDTPSQCTLMFLGLYCCRGNRACGRDKGAFRSPP